MAVICKSHETEIVFLFRETQCEVNRLRHGGVSPVDRVHLDIQGVVVHLQVPVGECLH